MLSLTYDGGNTCSWVAVQGQSGDKPFDKDPWFGKVDEYDDSGEHGGEEGTAMLKVIWLEVSKVKKAGSHRYQLSTSSPGTWIPMESVILFGINFQIHLVWQADATLLELKTPMGLIKKIWTSKNKNETFNQLVLSLSDDESSAIRGVVRKGKIISTNLWKAEEEITTDIFNLCTKQK